MRYLTSIALLCGYALPISAQSNGPVEAILELDSTTVIMPLAEADGRYEIEPVLAELSLTGSVDKIFDNGARLRARLAGRLQHEHPARPGGVGGFGNTLTLPYGAFSGLALNPVVEATANRARVELAYLQLDGGYGELRLGKNRGIAARFYEGAPSVFSHARLDSALLDPSGLSTVQTRHDVSGPSAKISYATPRIVGVRAGLSYTPEADADGLDRRLDRSLGLVEPNIDSVLELALNASRRFRDKDLRIDASLAWSQADIDDASGIFDYAQMQTLSAGTRIDYRDWRLGVSLLESDNGFQQADYSAWRAGIGHPWGRYDWTVDYGEAQDDAIALDAEGWRFGVSKNLENFARISVGYSYDRVRTGGLAERTQGIVVEITLSQEFMLFSGT